MQVTKIEAVADRWSVARSGSAWAIGGDGALAEVAPGAMRPDHDPATLGWRGILVEGPATNLGANALNEGMVSGSPGTLPAGVAIATSGSFGSVVRSLSGPLVEDGLPAFDLRYAGTTAGSCSLEIYLYPGEVAAAGEAWTADAYVTLAGGSLAGVTTTRLCLFETTSGGGYLVEGFTTIAPAAQALRRGRQRLTRTLTSGSTARVRPVLRVSFNGAVDFTLRIGARQLWKSALGYSPTFPVPGAPAASARAADDIADADAAYWMGADVGTIVVDFTPGQTVGDTTRGIISMDDGTAQNRVDLYLAQPNLGTFLTALSGGVTQVAALSIGTATALARNTLRFSWGPAGYFASLNGAAAVWAALGVAPAGLSRVWLGKRGGALSAYLNGWLGPRVAHFPYQYTSTPAPGGFTIRDR